MIEFTRCPVINGKAFETLEEAQLYGLEEILTRNPTKDPAATILEHAKDVIAILSVKQIGRPRSVPGQRKARKAKTPELVLADDNPCRVLK